jgi:hypothetical protein
VAVTYFQTSTASDLTGPSGTGGTSRSLVASHTAGGASADLATGNMNSSVFCNQNFFTSSGDPGTDGTSTGSFAVAVRISVQNANIGIRVFLRRATGGDTGGTEVEASGGSQTAGAASRTFSWTNPGLGTWASGDRLRIRVQLTNTSGSMNQSATIAVDTSADTVDTPFTSAPLSITPAAVTVNVTPGTVSVAKPSGPVRQFDGTDDAIRFSTTGLTGLGDGPYTAATIVKKTGSDNSAAYFWVAENATPTTQRMAVWAGLTEHRSYIDASIQGFGSAGTPAENVWLLVAISKADGSSLARIHIYNYSTQAWHHSNANNAQVDAVRAFDSIWIGGVSGNFLTGKVAAAGAWDVALSDVNIETMETGLQAWADLDAIWLTRFTQASTATPVEDLIGSNDEVAITGTTVDTADGPDSFDYTVTAGLSITPAAVTVNATPGALTVAPGAIDITPAAATVNVTPGTLSVAQSVSLTGPTVSVTAGTLTVTPGAVDITPAPTAVTITPGTVTVALAGGGTQEITPAAVTITTTPGTLTLDLAVDLTAPTVTVTPGTLAVGQGIVVFPDPVTITATPGALTMSTGAVGITPEPVTVTVTPGTLAVGLGVELAAPTVTVTPGGLTVAAGATGITPQPIVVQITPGVLVLSGGDTADPNPIRLVYRQRSTLTHREATTVVYREAQ